MLRSTLKICLLLASFSFMAACGGGDDAPDCTDMMAQMRGSMIVATGCTDCHSATSANRNGAPATVNFDNANDIDMFESGIRSRAISQKNMPPAAPLGTGPLNDGQISDLRAFLDCR
jgi:uncharacterized membrane protein